MSYAKNRAIIIAVIDGGMTTSQAAAHFHVSTRHIRRLLARHRDGGLEALRDRSRRPHTNPNATPTHVKEEILSLRYQLTQDGLDAGAASIHARLTTEHKPSPATIWRILKRHDMITPQPHKKPRSSWKRFQADLPNECWQSDFTHWRLATGTTVEIISWLDDHSRYLLHTSAHPRITGPIVTDTFTTTATTHGLPASTLTDNGMVYTTRLAQGNHRNNKRNAQPNAFEQLLKDLGIQQKNGAPAHPTTQGKIERFHQTLKKWLNAQPPATTITELDTLLADFQHIYNTTRPHRALDGKTPHHAYHATPKAQPTIELSDHHWRVRIDKVGPTGTITIRYAGKLYHLGIGRAHKNQHVIALAHGPNIIIIQKTTGEIIAEFTINPARNYQKKNPPTTPQNGHMS